MNSNLAIIIPAFKGEFLERTLHSISSQTNKNFTVYIGDDNSPYNLQSIVNLFINKLTIVYKKFDENFGSNSLIKQWDRCISLCKNEKWIWLFSDDDLMDSNCIAAFYATISDTTTGYDLYRFDTDMIDATDTTLYENPRFKTVTSSYEFVNKKLNGEIRSFVSEYIFSRSVYEDQRGFVDFPLAWASDDATWVKFGYKKGIYTIQNAKVYWRLSDLNISNSSNSHGNTKCIALIQYSNWLLSYFKDKYDLIETKHNLKKFFLSQLAHYSIKLTPNFTLYLYKNLKRTFGISYINLTLFLLVNKIGK
ncbi:MAG: glycosyltransferase [Rickettsiales bacterium]|nr:MAG: glycosyltransferase [Rickettsiales bacterium]